MSWKALKQCSDFAARLCPSQDPAAVIGVLHILKFLSDFEWQQTAFSPPDELTHTVTQLLTSPTGVCEQWVCAVPMAAHPGARCPKLSGTAGLGQETAS